MKAFNEYLKGLRGLILVWLSALGVFLDQLQPVAEQLLDSDISVAVAMAVITSLKLAWTDLRKKLYP